MPRKTERELLEEKTVKELKDMARDGDLSGYSQMVKDELIELINSNYTKAEIEAWAEGEEEETEEVPPEETVGEVEEEPGTTEMVEVEGELGPEGMVEVEEGLGEMPVEEKVEREEVEREAETFRKMLIGLIIVLVVVVIIAISWAVFL